MKKILMATKPLSLEPSPPDRRSPREVKETMQRKRRRSQTRMKTALVKASV